MPPLKLTACEAKGICLYKNLEPKSRDAVLTYFNRLKQSVIPRYAQIKIPHTSPASIFTQKPICCNKFTTNIVNL